MPSYIITGPDGKKYKVTGADAQGAYNALKRQLGGGSANVGSAGMSADIGASIPDIPLQAPPKGDASKWSTSQEGMETLTMGGQSKLNAAGAGLVNAAFNWGRGNGWDYMDQYNKSLQEQRDNQAAYNEEHPYFTKAGQAGGLAIGIARGPALGKGLLGATGTGAGYGFIGGALQDASSIEDRTLNAVKGTFGGALIGSGGYGTGKVLAKGAETVSKAFSTLNAPPLNKAEQEVFDLINKAGGPAAVQRKLAELGPDAALADVLGFAGTATTRRAANISPEARQILTDFVEGRKAGQNTRVVSDMEAVAGVKPSEANMTVDDLVSASNDTYRQNISSLYNQARAAGKDLPLEQFGDVIGTPQGKSVLRQAAANVKARASLAGKPDELSNLAIVDEMKKIFDSKATQAFRKGNKANGDLFSEFAKKLRTRADDLMSTNPDPIYRQARGAAQYAKKAEDAIRTGETLGGSRVTQDIPGQAANVDLQFRKKMAQGYVAKKRDTLLNRQSTEGAIGEFSTPMGRKAAEAALGPGALDKTLGRERQFNITNREIVGNSTTARQLAEMAGWGLGTATVSQLMGNDIWTTGITGLLGAVGRRSLPTIAQKLVTDKQRMVAPFLAEILTKAQLPLNRPIPPGFLEKFVTGGDQKLARTLQLMWQNSIGQNSTPQTIPAQ